MGKSTSTSLRKGRPAYIQLALARKKTKDTWSRYQIRQKGKMIEIKNSRGKVMPPIPPQLVINRPNAKGWAINYRT